VAGALRRRGGEARGDARDEGGVMNERINKLIRDTAAQIAATMRQAVIDAVMGDGNATVPSPAKRAGSATERAAARVLAGERVLDAALAEGIAPRSLSVGMVRMRKRGLLPASTVSRVACSADVRRRVIALMIGGATATKAAALCGVSVCSASRWYRKHATAQRRAA